MKDRGDVANLDINGMQLTYYEEGSGDPLIFVHGSASDYRTWHFQHDQFAKQFRAIVYSRRYHWPNESIPVGADYSMPGHVADLKALLYALDATPAHLAGYSYGAFLCLLLAISDPDLVHTLVLAEPPAITLFVSSTLKPQELLKLLITRPRTATAIVKFWATGVAPASNAFKQGDAQTGIRIFGDAVFGEGATPVCRRRAKRKGRITSQTSRRNCLGRVLPRWMRTRCAMFRRPRS